MSFIRKSEPVLPSDAHPIYSPSRLDLLEGLNYYEEHQPGLAADFYKELAHAELDVIEAPEFGYPLGKGYRRKHLRRYPYSLVYRIEGEDLILVVAVAHSSRKPNYWEAK